MKNWIDSHAHIYMKAFDADREAMVHRSRAEGVKKIYMPNVDASSVDAMLKVEQQYPDHCVAMMGLHPCYVKENFEQDLYQVETWLTRRKFAAIGEVGIDLYWDRAFFEEQKEAFVVQLSWAKKNDLPVVIHCRQSMDETIALLEKNRYEGMKGVFHCFTESRNHADRITELGFHIGLGGVSTFKNGGLDSVIPYLKPENVLLETDSPYLSPAPYRGQRNEPSYIPLIADKVADLMGVSLQELSASTTANAEKLFAT